MTADALNAALNVALDELSAFAKSSTQSLDPRAVLLTHPPAHRQRAADDLSSTITRLETLSVNCRSARQKIDDILAQVERSKHDCQLSLSPLSSLPDEILSRIFEFAIIPSSKPWEPSPTTAVLLSQVCSAWRTSTREHSRLWSEFFVHQHMPVELFDERVKLSNGRPLHVTVTDKLPKLPMETLEVSPRWLERVEHLVWSSSRHPSDSIAIRTDYGSTPRHPSSFRGLKTLELLRAPCDQCDGFDYPADELFDHYGFPQLRDLTIGPSVDINSVKAILAPRLISLKLHGTDCDAETLDRVLLNLPTLEILVLSNLRGLDLTPHVMTFQLARLQSLTLIALPPNSLLELIKPSRYPDLRLWEYVDRRDAGCGPELSEVLDEFGCQSIRLEAVRTRCNRHQMHQILFGLAQRGGEIRSFDDDVPRLRRLDVCLVVPWQPRQETDFHVTAEKDLIVTLGRLLRDRKEAGCAPLDELKIRTCIPADEQLGVIGQMVGRLTVDSHVKSFD